jgi:hypothetical protein
MAALNEQPHTCFVGAVEGGPEFRSSSKVRSGRSYFLTLGAVLLLSRGPLGPSDGPTQVIRFLRIPDQKG